MQTNTTGEIIIETADSNSNCQAQLTLSGNKTSIVFDVPSSAYDWNLDSDIESGVRVFKIHNNRPFLIEVLPSL